MSPVLRGEALPLPAREIQEWRERLARDHSDAVVPTPSGPYLLVRVPHREPEFLRDLEAAVDVMPYRDLKGFRGVLLIGDRAHMGVSPETLRALLEGREQAERDWVAGRRRTMEPWTFHVGRMPSDPKRRLRAVFRVDAESVEELDDPAFDLLAEMLPEVKAASPGQTRPAKAYVVAECDHVALDGGAFFSELERRRRRGQERVERKERQDLEERHELALAHLERILKQRGETMPRREALPPPPVDVPHGISERPSRTPPPIDVLRPGGTPRAEPVRDTPAPPAPPDPFRASARHPEAVGIIRHALASAGYKLKERLTVRDQPIALAGARLSGYPTRVLVAFFETFGPADARRLIETGRGVGAELVLCVAERTEAGTDRVTLATNLKVIPPSAVADLRFQ